MPGNPLLKGKKNGGHNPSGANGTGNGECMSATAWPISIYIEKLTGPEDDVLDHSLRQYAAERLSLGQRIRCLKDEHNLVIG
jgi:hypothetical protein